MKFKKIMWVAIILPLLGGCSSSTKMPIITDHTIISVPNYEPDFDKGYIAYKPMADYNSPFHYFNKKKVPYYNVVSYFREYIDLSADLVGLSSYSYSLSGHKISIRNDQQNETVTIDFDNQTIAYTNYTGFLSISGTKDYTNNFGISGGEKYFIGIRKHNIFSPKEYVIDLSKYNMPAYFENGQGYLPFYLFRNIFVTNTIMPFFFNGNGIYPIIGYGESQESIDMLKSIKEQGDQDYINSEDLRRFNYDLLALTLDNTFGMSERLSRVDGHRIKYLENGAYAALEPYKEKLMSIEPNVSNNAMFEIFDKVLNDGGHSGYGCVNLFSDKVFERQRTGEIGHTYAVKEKLTEARKQAGLSPEQVIVVDPSEPTPKSYYSEIGDVAFVTFDEFAAPMSDLTPDKINETNYYQDTISLIHYSNKQIKDHNIKKVVIDLSCNTGGAVYTGFFAASWLSRGSVTYKIGDSKSKGIYESTVHADVNLDRKFDENDYLGTDVKVYCIISNQSFSCGNLLPTLLEDNSSTKFIGERSGGGCCTVIDNYHLAIGGTMRLSSPICLLRNSATPENFVTNDDGVVPAFYKINSQTSEIANFYDRAKIVEKINLDI